MPKAERCKVNGPNVRNPDDLVWFLKTEHVWEWETFGKCRNPNVRISALYCIFYHDHTFLEFKVLAVVFKGHSSDTF